MTPVFPKNSSSSSSTTTPNNTWFSFLWEWLWYLLKYIYHIYTGKSEIERICERSRQHNQGMSFSFADSILNSRKLSESLVDPDTNYLRTSCNSVNQVYVTIFNEKNFNTERPHVVANVKHCIRDMIHVNDTIQRLKKIKEASYDENNPRHEELLEKLWQNLADDEAKGQPERDWTLLGFQRHDQPRSDFRGMGELGLQNLVVFSEMPVGKRFLVESHQLDYSFAITGINLTGDLYKKLTTQVEPKYKFMNHKLDGVERFHEIYSEVFVRFHQYWKKRKPNIMEFNQVKKEFWAELESQNFWNAPSHMKTA